MPREELLGHYRLVRMLGRGGMGQVWLAEDTRLGREVALKLLPHDLAEDLDYRRRFEREAKLAARLRGPHIVPIHAFGELDGRLYIDMELIEGSDLGKILREEGSLPLERAVDLVAQVAAALDIAHKAGLVHRDVKPSNVLTMPDGFAYLIDFGIARGAGQTAITSTGVAVGTWAYMAPERYSGAEDHRSDVYSLACLLFECLTGRKPFDRADPIQQMAAHLNSEPPRASDHNSLVPATLDAVIARGLAKEPAHRYPSAGALAEAARAALDGHTPRPLPRTPAPPTARWDGGPSFSQDPTPYTPPPHGGMLSSSAPSRPGAWGSDAGVYGSSPSRPAVDESAWNPMPSASAPAPGESRAGSTPPAPWLPGNSGGAVEGPQAPWQPGKAAVPVTGPRPQPNVAAPVWPVAAHQNGGFASAPQPFTSGIPLNGGAAPIPVRGGHHAAPPGYGLPAADPLYAQVGSPVGQRSGPDQPIGFWRVLWWIVLVLLILFFGLFSAAGIDVAVTEQASGAGEAVATAIALLLFFLPFVLFCWLGVREIKRFRARRPR